MPVTIDRETRLEETLVEIAELAEAYRCIAVSDGRAVQANQFKGLRIIATEAAESPSTTSFTKEFDPETVGDEEFRRELVLILTKKFNPDEFNDFANAVVSTADAIIARMKR